MPCTRNSCRASLFTVLLPAAQNPPCCKRATPQCTALVLVASAWANGSYLSSGTRTRRSATAMSKGRRQGCDGTGIQLLSRTATRRRVGGDLLGVCTNCSRVRQRSFSKYLHFLRRLPSFCKNWGRLGVADCVDSNRQPPFAISPEHADYGLFPATLHTLFVLSMSTSLASGSISIRTNCFPENL